MSHAAPGPLAAYSSLQDKHLVGYFNNSRMKKHLKKSGLVSKKGQIVDEKTYRLSMAKKEHRKHVRDLLATAIIHKALDMERTRQYEIRKRLDDIYKVDLVRKVKDERKRKGDEDILPLLSPRERTARRSSRRSRPSTAPAGINIAQGTVQPSEIHYDDSTGKLYYTDTAMNSYLKDEDDVNAGSPYTRAYPGTYPVPAPPPTGTPRRTRPVTSPRRKLKLQRYHYLARTEPAVAHRVQLQSMAEVTMKFVGPSLVLTNSLFPEDRLSEVMVLQQHCGGSTLCVFRELLPPNTIFTFISRRHRGAPFGLTFYIDGMQDIRLSACCEYKHKPGYILGGRNGHFQFVQVEGAAPCYRCQVASGVRSPKPKQGTEAEEDADRNKTFLTQDEEGEDSRETFDVIITKIKPEEGGGGVARITVKITSSGYEMTIPHSGEKVDTFTQTPREEEESKTEDKEAKKEEKNAETPDEVEQKDEDKKDTEPSVEKYEDDQFDDDEEEEKEKEKEEERESGNESDRSSSSSSDSESEKEKEKEKDVTGKEDKTEDYKDDFEAEESGKEDGKDEDKAKEEEPEEDIKDETEKKEEKDVDDTKDTEEVEDETEPEPVKEQEKQDEGHQSDDSDSDMKPPKNVSFDEEVQVINDNEEEAEAQEEGEAKNGENKTDESRDNEDEVAETPEEETEIPDTVPDEDESAKPEDMPEVEQPEEDKKEEEPTPKQEKEPKNDKDPEPKKEENEEKMQVEVEDNVDAVESKPDDELEIVSPETSDSESSSSSSSSDDENEKDNDKDEYDHDPGNDPDLVAGDKLPNQALKAIGVEPGTKHEGSIKPMIEGKKDIEITGVAFTPEQIGELAAAVESKGDVGSITLRNATVDDDAMEKLATALKNTSSVKMLNLNVNQVGPEGAKHVADVIRENKSLRMLLLHGNPLNDQGVHHIVDAIIETEDTSITNLDLGDCGMKDDGAADIARLLENNTSITDLNVSCNVIGREGWKKISTGLAQNSCLKALSLDFCQLDDEDAKIIAEGLKNNKSLRSLDLEGNRIGDEGGKSFLEALKVNETLVDLTLMPMNNISRQIYDEIKEFIDNRVKGRTPLASGSSNEQQTEDASHGSGEKQESPPVVANSTDNEPSLEEPEDTNTEGPSQKDPSLEEPEDTNPEGSSEKEPSLAESEDTNLEGTSEQEPYLAESKDMNSEGPFQKEPSLDKEQKGQDSEGEKIEEPKEEGVEGDTEKDSQDGHSTKNFDDIDGDVTKTRNASETDGTPKSTETAKEESTNIHKTEEPSGTANDGTLEDDSRNLSESEKEAKEETKNETEKNEESLESLPKDEEAKPTIPEAEEKST